MWLPILLLLALISVLSLPGRVRSQNTPRWEYAKFTCPAATGVYKNTVQGEWREGQGFAQVRQYTLSLVGGSPTPAPYHNGNRIVCIYGVNPDGTANYGSDTPGPVYRYEVRRRVDSCQLVSGTRELVCRLHPN